VQEQISNDQQLQELESRNAVYWHTHCVMQRVIFAHMVNKFAVFIEAEGLLPRNVPRQCNTALSPLPSAPCHISTSYVLLSLLFSFRLLFGAPRLLFQMSKVFLPIFCVYFLSRVHATSVARVIYSIQCMM
jgi:hypothetical protein